MQELIDKILKILKDHVRQNNLEIELNQDEIKRILSEDVSSSRGNDDLEYKKSINQELIHENDDFISLQLNLAEFMEKYGHLISDPDINPDPDFVDQMDEENLLPYFDQTVEGNLKFEPGHPQFNNTRFFNELLRYYQEKEDYEKCDELVKIKRSYNNF